MTEPGEKSVGELVLEVSEQTSALVREEIELAKAEVREKVQKLIRGSVVGIAAGVFVLAGLSMLLFAIGWLLDDLFFSDHIWIGFAIEAAFWFLVAAIAGLAALRSFRAGAPPVPEMAIEEGRLIRETLESGSGE